MLIKEHIILPLSIITILPKIILIFPKNYHTKLQKLNQRSEKLDNKVYIILTVYAFLFVLLCDIIKKISDFSFPKDNVQLALLIIYSILLTLNVSLYVLTLIQLTHLLKGVAIQRFDPQIILKREMIDANSKAVAKYICSRYNQCIDTNKNILEKRFEKFKIYNRDRLS